MGTTDPMPAAFLGHGNPMNTLEHNRYTDAWRAFGESLGRPRGVLVISAHWYINASAVTAMERPRTIHDFYGFPRELFAFEYPAPGAPDLAEEVTELAQPDQIGLDGSSWGLDHGTWSVLAHVFPAADVPVVQLSINALQPFEYHMGLAARLAPLRERGIVILGSGNLVHNLHRLDWELPDSGYDWAQAFDTDARGIMTRSPGDVLELRGRTDFPLAAPTPDHFIPLLYLASLADVAGDTADVLVDGCAYGSVSMTAFTLGAELPKSRTDTRLAAATAPGAVPADQTNL